MRAVSSSERADRYLRDVYISRQRATQREFDLAAEETDGFSKETDGFGALTCCAFLVL